MRAVIGVMLCLVLLPAAGDAQMNRSGLYISSGTGFFVDTQHVVTNAHVVQNCHDVLINVSDVVQAQKATVLAKAKDADLALVQVNMAPWKYASLRSGTDGLKPGDKVLLPGFPGREGARGRASLATSTIQRIDEGGIAFIISHAANHGNSGGPVLDASGNVIGVITASMTPVMSAQPGNGYPPSNPVNPGSDVAISLGVLKQFLAENGVTPQSQISTETHDDQYIETDAKAYIVNIQCTSSGDEGAAVQPRAEPLQSELRQAGAQFMWPKAQPDDYQHNYPVLGVIPVQMFVNNPQQGMQLETVIYGR